jgi:hypothetical protein
MHRKASGPEKRHFCKVCVTSVYPAPPPETLDLAVQRHVMLIAQGWIMIMDGFPPRRAVLTLFPRVIIQT